MFFFVITIAETILISQSFTKNYYNWDELGWLFRNFNVSIQISESFEYIFATRIKTSEMIIGKMS